MEIKERAASYKDELLEKLGKLVAINSVESTPLENAPFGIGPKEALDVALKMCEDEGFAVKNLENYIGYAEMGQGDEVIGIIGHLDIVPANKEDGWDSDPFTMVEHDGKLYGRGVTDDKGPLVAGLIAMKILRDMNVPVNKRIRLIMGCNEETGAKGLAHYVEKEGSVDYGFTPDGNFPCIYGEKGVLAGQYRSKSTKILDIKGGAARNVVCPKVTIKVPHGTYDAAKLESYLTENGLSVTVTTEGDVDTLVVVGKSAHASTPEYGINSISYALVGLKTAGFEDPFVEFYNEHFGTAYDGRNMGADLSDEYGALTWNHGVIGMNDGVIEGSIDIRFPVTMNSKAVLKAMEGHLEDENGAIEFLGSHEPLFVPKDSKLVTSLMDAYRKVTGDLENDALTIGGGTYAKGIANTVAFGCEFPGRNYHIHEANEESTVEELLLQVEIYVQAVLNLLAL